MGGKTSKTPGGGKANPLKPTPAPAKPFPSTLKVLIVGDVGTFDLIPFNIILLIFI